MNSFSFIVVKVQGIVSNNKTIDNFNNTIASSDILAVINRQDVNCNALINFSDFNNTCMIKVDNFNLDYFNFNFYDENNEVLTDIQDWLMILQVKILKKKSV